MVGVAFGIELDAQPAPMLADGLADGGEFSPTPAVKTMASMPFMAQPRPAMPSATRQAK